MKILIEESVLRQALETFTHCYAETDRRINERAKILVELRTTLNAAEKVEPVAWKEEFANRKLFESVAKVCKFDVTRLGGVYLNTSTQNAWESWRDAHPAPAVPEGWQIVPKEPTDEMLRTLDGCNFQLFNPRNKSIRVGTYKVLLSAAPTPPTNTECNHYWVRDQEAITHHCCQKCGAIKRDDDSELREAARAVVAYFDNNGIDEPKELDRLENTLTKLTISESALALILLENELDNNFQEVRRWQRRADEAQQSLNEAKSRLTRNQELLMKVKANISNADCYSRFG